MQKKRKKQTPNKKQTATPSTKFASFLVLLQMTLCEPVLWNTPGNSPDELLTLQAQCLVLLFQKVITLDGSPVFCSGAWDTLRSRKASLQEHCWCCAAHGSGGCPASAAGMGCSKISSTPGSWTSFSTHGFSTVLWEEGATTMELLFHQRCCSASFAGFTSPNQKQGRIISFQHTTLWPRFPLGSRNKVPTG